MNKITNYHIGKLEYILTITGSVASIISVLILLFHDKSKAIFALIFVILFLTILIIRIFILIKNYFKLNYPNEIIKISTSYKYITNNDGTMITYEVYKTIQSKTIMLNEHEHRYDWSGTEEPVIESDLQEIMEKIKGGKNKYGKVKLRFKEPLLYNEIGIVHIKMICNDSNKKSRPYLESRVEEPTKMVQFQTILKHKNNEYKLPARLLKRKIHSEKPEEYQNIGSVEFDIYTKSYSHTLLTPEIGYFYKLEWDK